MTGNYWQILQLIYVRLKLIKKKEREKEPGSTETICSGIFLFLRTCVGTDVDGKSPGVTWL